MKRAPLLVLAGTVAGFVGVLTFHTRPVSATTPGQAQPSGTPSASSASSASAAASPAASAPAPGGRWFSSATASSTSG